MGPFGDRFLLSRPEHAEHVLATHQDNFVKPFTAKGLRALIGDGLVTSDGETWRRHRRLVQPLFSRRNVATFGPAIVGASRRMLNTWAGRPAGTELDVAAAMSALALDAVGQALFSADLTGDADQMSRAMKAGQRVALIAGLLTLPCGPRSARAVKATAKRLGRTPEGIEGFTGRLMAARRADPGPGASRPDLLDVLLTGQTEDGSPLADAEISAEIAAFLVAGHETMANTLSWSLALLSAFPAARGRLEDEVDSVLGGREPAAADFARLPWTLAVISESMRLYPPAWTIGRNAIADDNIAGVEVAAGSLVAISPYLIHRHPEFWPDPAGFDPERFLPSGPERPRYTFIPFGGGRRACVGQWFAELEAVLVLAAITQQYRLELTAAGIPKPTAQVTLRPARGLPMRLARR
jgi:cytochrome P450